MANPPPIRPWFRLASVRTASAPAPAPEAGPVFSIPTFRSTYSAPSSPQTQPTKPREPIPPPPQPQPQPQPRVVAGSAPSSPDKKVAPAPSSSLPTSPIQKASLTNTNTNHYSISPSSSPSHKMRNASSSAKTIKAESVYNSPIHSPNLKPNAPPPSPLILPPSQFNYETNIPKEAEQKTVLVQKNVEKPRQRLNGNDTELHRESWNNGNSHHEKGKVIETKEISSHKKASASAAEDSGMKVITIAGENRGAYMELVHSQKKHEPKYLHKKGNDSSKINGDGDDGGDVESEDSSNGIEASSGRKDKNHKGKTTSKFPMAAYMNSNVQCVNNSLLYHASCSHHDPGVRLSLSKKPHGEGYDLKEGVDGYNKVG